MTNSIMERLDECVRYYETFTMTPMTHATCKEARDTIEELVEALKHCRDRFVRDGTSTFVVDGVLAKIGGDA
jgi:hypothetical protein